MKITENVSSIYIIILTTGFCLTIIACENYRYLLRAYAQHGGYVIGSSEGVAYAQSLDVEISVYYEDERFKC